MSNGRKLISNKQTNAPAIGTNGTKGVLNPLGASGFFLRSTIIPIQTMIKASRVPIETISPNKPMGNIPAKNAATLPVTIVVICGV